MGFWVFGDEFLDLESLEILSALEEQVEARSGEVFVLLPHEGHCLPPEVLLVLGLHLIDELLQVYPLQLFLNAGGLWVGEALSLGALVDGLGDELV